MRVQEPEASAPFSSVILAAGTGRRIGRLGRAYPKALLPVLDRPMIAWQLEALKRHGIEEAVLVVGYLGDRIREVLGDGKELGMRLVYREQSEPEGIAHALACARDVLERPFLVLLGDVFFGPGDLDGVLGLMREPGTDGVLVVREEPDAERVRRNYTVELDDDRFVRRVEEKPATPATTLKGTGLYAFRPDVFEAIDRTERSPLRGELELTDAIQVHIERGAKLRAFETRARDFNLSSVPDLLDLNLHALAGEGRGRLVVSSATLEEGVLLERAVVLAGACVERGSSLVDCLVMPGERVRAGSYERVVFAGGDAVACGAVAPPGDR